MRRYLAVVFAAAMLVGCGQTHNIDIETPSNASGLSESQIKIGEEVLEVPFAFEEMERVGYKLTGADFATINHNQSCVAYFENEAGQSIVTGLGTLEDNVPIEESMVIDILADDMNTESSNLKVYGDIGLGSTKEEVQAVYGEPSYSLDDQEMYTLGITEQNGIIIALQDGKVCRVEVMMLDDYIE